MGLSLCIVIYIRFSIDRGSMACFDAKEAAFLTSRALLDIGAINFNIREPYRLTSGMRSPVYIDCRRLISYPRIRCALMDFAVSMLDYQVGFESFDAIAGGETAGIPFAAFIAERMGLPMVYVRKKAKGFGRNVQIEGDIGAGKRVLLVEDLATNGASKLGFVKTLREAGADVSHSFVVFSYGIFPKSLEHLERLGVRLWSLACWNDVLPLCVEQGYFDQETLESVRVFLQDPEAWDQNWGR